MVNVCKWISNVANLMLPAQTWKSSNKQRKLRHVGTVHNVVMDAKNQQLATWLHSTPSKQQLRFENGWDLRQFDPVFCLTFQGTNAQTTATPQQQPCSYTTQLECIHFCLSRINLACGSTVEPLKKKWWWICRRSFGLCGNNIPFFPSHFSYESCHKFGFKLTIFGLWHLGTGCTWSDHDSVCVYIHMCVRISTNIYPNVDMYMHIYKHIYILGCISNSFSLGRPRV